MTRLSRHAAVRSSSDFGASGTSSSPSAARLRSSPSGCATSAARWPISRKPLTVSRTWFCPPRQVRAVSMWSENMVQGSAFRVRRSEFQFPEFGEFQRHVIRVHARNRQPGPSVQKPALEDVIAKEGELRLHEQIERRRAPALLEHLLRRERRVVLDRLHVLVDVAIRVML